MRLKNKRQRGSLYKKIQMQRRSLTFSDGKTSLSLISKADTFYSIVCVELINVFGISMYYAIVSWDFTVLFVIIDINEYIFC